MSSSSCIILLDEMKALQSNFVRVARRLFSVTPLIIGMSFSVQAQEHQQVRDLFAQKHYAQAEELLRANLNQSSAEDWSILGTLIYHQNRLGEAYLALRFAQSLNPFDWGIRERWLRVRDEHTSRMGIYDLDRAKSWTETAASSVPFRLIAVLLILILMVLSTWAWWTRRFDRKFVETPAGTVWIVILISAVGVVGIERWGSTSNFALVKQSELVARSGPDDQFLALATLRHGMEVVLTGETRTEDASEGTNDRPVWVQVRFDAGRLAWLPEDSLLLLPAR